ncbi:MAG TPA: thiamine phosphate synthase, partial [Capsulimonadaceae bacterium]|nr:thiamine phosphate synthase [Capsulimonadaceae bacterium]
DELIRLARRLCAMAHRAGALFIMNDQVDIALAAGADGVHLGPDDMHPSEARRYMREGLVGASVNSVEEAIPLAPFVSYFGVGAIYGSSTKGDAGPPIGTEPIRRISSRFLGIPIVAIGGITKENIATVKRAGADSAAVVSAVVCASDMEQATRDLVDAWNQA